MQLYSWVAQVEFVDGHIETDVFPDAEHGGSDKAEREAEQWCQDLEYRFGQDIRCAWIERQYFNDETEEYTEIPNTHRDL